MDLMKSIIESLATIAKRKAGDCEKCSGGGSKYFITGCGDCEIKKQDVEQCICPPCPTCQPLRIVAEMKWHEKESLSLKCLGGTGHAYINPTPDIPALRKLMETVGVWEKFEQWHAWQVIILKEPKWNEPAGKIWILDYMISNSASMDILTSDKFYTVVEEFLKREVEG